MSLKYPRIDRSEFLKRHPGIITFYSHPDDFNTLRLRITGIVKTRKSVGY
jgi:hypothetical protein